MYSAVLMLAMAGAPETPAFHGFFSCLFHCPTTYGCGGCWSSPCYSHWSGGYGSCYGSCYGSGYGYGYSSCMGYGIYGGATYSWPTPSYGCYGSGCYGYGYGYGMPPVQGTIITSPKVEEIPAPKKEMMKGGTSYIPALPGQARVVINLPADAKLYADGVATTLTSGSRSFVTPVLEKGKDFQYQMKVEYQRGGQTLTETRRVVVRADTVVRVDFTDKQKFELVSSQFTVKLPQGAKLFVDGEAREVPPQGEFRTPELIKGNEYVYLFKAELDSKGAKQAQTQRVVFKAGEPVRVDFSDMLDVTRVSSK